MKPAEVATNFLIPFGFKLKVKESPRLEILGGLTCEDEGDIKVYSDAFTLWEERDGTYSASVTGRGQLGLHITGVPLDEALEFVGKRYR